MASSKKGIGGAFIDYLRNSKEELRKVSWPTRNDLIKNTIGVIIASLAIAVFLFWAIIPLLIIYEIALNI